MNIINIAIDKVIPYVNNPRNNEGAVDKVASSIKEFGFKVPIVIDKDNVVVTGHTRLLASKKLGLKEVPCVVADDLTPAQIKAFRIADNKVSEYAEWNDDLLKLELEQLQEMEFDLELTGFNLDEIELGVEEPQEYNEENDVIEEPPVTPYSKRGDIWLLGRHRLMCGSSTEEADVKVLMNENKADMVFTDPPYLIETKGGCNGEIGKALKKQGNDIEFISNFDPMEFVDKIKIPFDKNKMNAYVFCNKELLLDYLSWGKNNKYSYNVLVWKKPNAIPIGDSHRPDIEYLILFRKNAIWNNGIEGVNYSRCLEYGREKGLHPTMKPIELIANEILISSNEKSVTVDFFGGSGSTLIASDITNRINYSMELDEKYVDVIVKRYINHKQNNGEDVILIRNGKEYKFNDISKEFYNDEPIVNEEVINF